MSVIIAKKKSRNKQLIWYTLEWGKQPGQRIATGIFTYTKPKDQIQKNHNKESLTIIETKRSQLILDQQSIGIGYIPAHKYKNNFLDYYTEFVKNNRREGNRHIEGSLNHFKKFLKKDHISPIEITENLCMRFRKFLLDHFNGDTPANYFARFKKVLRAATKEGYFRINPADDVAAKGNQNKKLKEHLEADEYIKLINTPCANLEVKEAFVYSCYTALRWVDVKSLDWLRVNHMLDAFGVEQAKTKVLRHFGLHPIAKEILKNRKKKFGNELPTGKVFHLPSNNGANEILQNWVNNADINKHITWHCARLSFSILLQDENVDLATVAYLLGHTSTKHVHHTYKRHRPKTHEDVLDKLPSLSRN